MNVVVSERPGVYTGFDAASAVSAVSGAGAVGVVCTASGITSATRYLSASAAKSALGASSTAARLVEIALWGGACACVVSPVGSSATAEDYAAAAKALRACEDIRAIVCDSDEMTVWQALRDEAVSASGERRERLAVFAAGGEASALVTKATSLASERCVLFGPAPVGSSGAAIDCAELACAGAAAIAATVDPAVPLGGASLAGLYGAGGALSDSVVDTLVRGGVSPLECQSGEVVVVRGVTTRVKTGGEPDTTWRELSTVLIVDDVMKTLRSSLRAKFARAKNLASTREAVASQVTIELEKKKAAGIIADYGAVSASTAADDPTRCDVEFEFATAHGMDRVVVTAHLVV